MGKKQKEEIPNVNTTANRDIVQRLNFLYQASVYLQSIAPPPDTTTERDDARKIDIDVEEGPSMAQQPIPNVQKRMKRRNIAKKSTADLARSYVQCMHVVGQKTTVKMDPSLKRTLCPHCSTTLVPGSSASVRVKRSRPRSRVLLYTCLHCRNSKRIPAPEISSTNSPLSVIDAVATQTEGQVTSSVSNAVLSVPASSGTNPTKKRPSIREPPLFARLDAGHVVFRGNAQHPVDSAQSGFGVFLV